MRPYLLALASLTAAAPLGAQVRFSVDWNSPTVGMADCAGLPITEGDLMSPCAGAPGFGPLPPPIIAVTAGPGGLGLGGYAGCVGHFGGTPCIIEVDAYSNGEDRMFLPNVEIRPGSIWFSVDEYSGGIVGTPAPPAVWTESVAGDSSADMFANNMPWPPAPLPPFAAPPGNTGVLDGNGLPSPFVYPGVGLIEPNFPSFGPFAPGDNLDAFDDGFAPAGVVPAHYWSMDGFLPDPCTGIPDSGSALAHGFAAGDVLTVGAAGGPIVYAPAPALGLDFFGMHSDDLDALILRENGNGVFNPPNGPYSWVSGGTDMILFSVRRGSAVIGMPDSLTGTPIEEGDILMPPIVGGASPFPAIFIAAENLGLGTVRSGAIFGACPFGDELDALDYLVNTITDCNANGIEDSIDIAMGFSADANANGIPDECENPLIATPYCFCPQGSPAPCFNFDASAGCRNSTGPGGLLSATGTSSIVADDLVLTASQLPLFQFGLIYMGDLTIGPLPFGDGLRCVGGNVCRFPVQNAGAAGSITRGPGLSAYSLANFPAVCWIVAGSTWNFQGWYRDPAGPCASGFNTTNAISVTFY